MFVRLFVFLLLFVFPAFAFAELAPLYNKAEQDGSVRVIVTFKTDGYDSDESARRAGLKSLPAGSFELKREFGFLPAAVIEVTAEGLRLLEESGVAESIEEDALIKLPEVTKEEAMIYSLPAAIGEETAWQSGYTGSGYYVAVLDTGIRRTHEAFAGKDIVEACFSSEAHCPNGQTVMTGAGAAALYDSRYPQYSHGTHVSGIAVGNATGIAKGADLIAVQVFSMYDSFYLCENNGDCLLAHSSDQIDALGYIYSLKDQYNIASVNLSLGGDCTIVTNVTNSMRTQIQNLTNAGIAVVAAAGNSGDSNVCSEIALPACISEAVAVGAVTNDDARLHVSMYKKGLLDLYAPGVQVLSAGADSDDDTLRLSGTSMATPHVAGAFAVLMEKDPAATVVEIENLMKSTGTEITGACADNNNEKRVNLAAAVGGEIEPVITNGSSGGGGGGGGCSASERGGVPLLLFAVAAYLLFNLRRRA